MGFHIPPLPVGLHLGDVKMTTVSRSAATTKAIRRDLRTVALEGPRRVSMVARVLCLRLRSIRPFVPMISLVGMYGPI